MSKLSSSFFKIAIACQVTEIFHFKVGAQNEQKVIIFNEQNLIISILGGDY